MQVDLFTLMAHINLFSNDVLSLVTDTSAEWKSPVRKRK